MKLAAVLLILATAMPMFAQKKGKPGKFDYYLLTLSWSPEFCSTKPSDPQCTGTRKFAFVVHGMWPQFQNGTWPQNCSTKAGLSNPQSMLDIMPSKTLIQHEWTKHGTCSGLGPQDYFDLTRKAFDSIKIPAKYQEPQTAVTTRVSDLKDAFRSSNPDLANSAFSVACSSKFLSEVRICLDKQLKPMDCGAKDTCKRTDVVMPPVR